MPDAFDLQGQDVGHGDKGAAGHRAGKNRGLPVDDDAQAARLKKMAIEKGELEEGLAREGRILGRERKAAKINRRDADGSDALDEGILGIKERMSQRARFPDGGGGFQGRMRRREGFDIGDFAYLDSRCCTQEAYRFFS